MDLILSEQFYIITYLEVDLLLIIYHLTYLIFLVNLLNQFFDQPMQLTFLINLQLNWQHH